MEEALRPGVTPQRADFFTEDEIQQGSIDGVCPDQLSLGAPGLACDITEDWSPFEDETRPQLSRRLPLGHLVEGLPRYAVDRIKDFIVSFVFDFTEKYANGEREHQADLLRLPITTLLGHAREEVLDQWSYVKGTSMKVAAATSCVHAAIAELEMMNPRSDMALKHLFDAVNLLDGS